MRPRLEEIFRKASFFSDAQWRFIKTAARRNFRKPEDQKDFVQECALVAWETMTAKGVETEKRYKFDVNLVIKVGRRNFLKAQFGLTASRHGERPWRDPAENIRRAHRTSLSDALDSLMPSNPRDAEIARLNKLLVEKEIAIYFDDYDLIEIMGWKNKKTLIHSRMNARRLLCRAGGWRIEMQWA